MFLPIPASEGRSHQSTPRYIPAFLTKLGIQLKVRGNKTHGPCPTPSTRILALSCRFQSPLGTNQTQADPNAHFTRSVLLRNTTTRDRPVSHSGVATFRTSLTSSFQDILPLVRGRRVCHCSWWRLSTQPRIIWWSPGAKNGWSDDDSDHAAALGMWGGNLVDFPIPLVFWCHWTCLKFWHFRIYSDHSCFLPY